MAIRAAQARLHRGRPGARRARTPSSQAADHFAQLDKRRRKLTAWHYGERWADVEGDRDADRAIVTFGSCTGPVREGLARAAADGVKARLVSLRLLAPLPANQLSPRSTACGRVLVIEQNHTRSSTSTCAASATCRVASPACTVRARCSTRRRDPRHLIDWSRPHEHDRQRSDRAGHARTQRLQSDVKPVWCRGFARRLRRG